MRVNGIFFGCLCVCVRAWVDAPFIKLFAWPSVYDDRALHINVDATLPSTLNRFDMAFNYTVTVQCMEPHCQYSIVRTNSADVRALVLGNVFASALSADLEKVHNQTIIVRAVVEEVLPVSPPVSPSSPLSPSLMHVSSETSHNANSGQLSIILGVLSLFFTCACCCAYMIREHNRHAQNLLKYSRCKIKICPAK